MNYEKLIVEVPKLSDEAAAYLQRFLYDLMYAIDEHYSSQIQRYYVRASTEEMTKEYLRHDELEDPPF